MAGASDRYTDWLGIPDGPRPPDHYTLLGLQRFESDSKVIEHAAVARVKKLRPLCMKFATEASQLLNEISKARMCLSDPEERDAYDKGLRHSDLPIAELPISKPVLDDEVDSWDDDDESVDWEEVASLSSPAPITSADQFSSPKQKRYCPHCGGSLLAKETICLACSRGLARSNDWLGVLCPSCKKTLMPGTVLCIKCKADHALPTREGTLPPRIANTIRPFQYRDQTHKTDDSESDTYALQSPTEPPKRKKLTEAPKPLPSKAIIDALNTKLRPGWRSLRSPFHTGACVRCGIAMPILEERDHVAPCRAAVLHAYVSQTGLFLTAFQLARFHFFGLSLDSLPREPTPQLIAISDSIERMALKECDRCGSTLCVHCSRANLNEVGCTMCGDLADDQVEFHSANSKSAAGSSKEPRCPRCGFSYKWDGVSCGHCHPQVSQETELEEPGSGAEAGCATTILLWMTGFSAVFWIWFSQLD